MHPNPVSSRKCRLTSWIVAVRFAWMPWRYVQKMSAYIVDRSGQVRVDDLAFDAAMSARHLRRLFLEQMGLTPKHFCRVIRFRHSLPRLRSSVRGDWTKDELDCGYYG